MDEFTYFPEPSTLRPADANVSAGFFFALRCIQDIRDSAEFA